VREAGRGHGWLPQERLFEEMARAAAVLVPTRGEGFGMVALEAMALGRPVVVPDLPAFREVLSDFPFYVGEGGWGAAAARALAAPPERLAAARAHARGFSWERAAARLQEVIERVRSRR
jgi:glycosyltransferase involved in cell wall biosynthesis